MTDFLIKKIATAMIFMFAVIAALQGCSHAPEYERHVNRNIDVFGVELYSSVDHRVLEGERSEREPCILGYEYSFEQLDVTIGYTHEGFVRLIKTRNERTSLFAVHPGMSLAESNIELTRYGFRPGEAPNTFRQNNLTVTLLTNAHDMVFGVVAEAFSGE